MDLNQKAIDKKNISHDSDMTIYEQYLHLLLIKTSDKYIQDRYQIYLNKINMGKEKKQTFFQRMKEDIQNREDNKKELLDNMSVSEQSLLGRAVTKTFMRKKTTLFKKLLNISS